MRYIQPHNFVNLPQMRALVFSILNNGGVEMYKIAMFFLALCVTLGAIAYAEPGSTYDPADRAPQGDRPDMGNTRTNMNMNTAMVTGTIQRVDVDKNSIMIREDKSDSIQ